MLLHLNMFNYQDQCIDDQNRVIMKRAAYGAPSSCEMNRLDVYKKYLH